jgi:FKBP-type peptidyl-prolyl cis-trans isomerase FklB
MKKSGITVFLICLLSVCLFVGSNCQRNNELPVEDEQSDSVPVKDTIVKTLKSYQDTISYCIGLNIGKNIKKKGIAEVDAQKFLAGLKDAFRNSPPLIDMISSNDLVLNHVEKLYLQNAIANILEGDSFIVANREKPDINELESGLQYTILKKGKGQTPRPEDNIKVIYEGRFINGKIFDSSNKGPVEFRIKWSTVPKGWKAALLRMEKGARWKIILPPHLAYGSEGYKNYIPPYKTLIFEIELVDILKEYQE